jgi:hypothetical protein
MGIDRPFLGQDIAPTDHFAGRYRDKLGMAAFDVVEYEGPHHLDRRGFQERQISPLPRNKIEGPMKAINMPFRYRNNFDWIHRPGNVSGRFVPPLAERPRNNYLGSSPPTTD